MEKKLNYLTAYAVISSCLICFVLLSGFLQKNNNENFDEITVKRINIVAEDGNLRMVLSNENRQHSGRMNGIDIEKRERPAGIIFFNEESDECGGLSYYGNTEDGQTYSGMSFSMDQYKEDQVIQILNEEVYADGKERIRRGISIMDIPTGSDLFTRMDKIKEIQTRLESMNEEDQKKLIAEIGNSLGTKQRLFIGRTGANNSGMFLAGPDGRQKIRIYVDENGTPIFEVIDNEGNSRNILKTN